VIKVLFLFPSSADRGALDAFIESTHVPFLKQTHGCRSVIVSSGDLMSPGGPPPFSRVVEASFETLGDVMATVEAPEAQSGRQQIRDLGTLVLMYEVSES
jgi:uncharacterized protein (TIGR02118 family)